MESLKTSEPSLENQQTGLLSTTFETQQDAFTRRRSTSITPSVRSGRSVVTVVEEHSEVPVLDRKAVQRRHTQTVEIKITRWSCLKGFLFGSHITERVAVATIKAPDVDDGDGDAFDNKECPFILSVHVLPSAKAGTEEHQQARCTFDTGCLQGNIISKSFAHKLGFSEPEYKPLSPREKHGGTSVTGQIHMPEGVLHLTWYHNSSPLLFRDMRFLVSSVQQCDIVIGAHSIVKHKLLSLPNFGIIGDRLPLRDEDFDEHRQMVAELESNLESLQHEKGQDMDEHSVKRRGKNIRTLKEKLVIEKLRRNISIAKKDLKKYPKDMLKKERLEQLEIDLDKITKGSFKDEKTLASKQSEVPHIRVLEVNGNTRSATGFSNNSSGRSRARK